MLLGMRILNVPPPLPSPPEISFWLRPRLRSSSIIALIFFICLIVHLLYFSDSSTVDKYTNIVRFYVTSIDWKTKTHKCFIDSFSLHTQHYNYHVLMYTLGVDTVNVVFFWKNNMSIFVNHSIDKYIHLLNTRIVHQII